MLVVDETKKDEKVKVKTKEKKPKKNKITREKLNKKDYYRCQVQFDTMADKMLYAAMYNYLAAHYPHIAKTIRDSMRKHIMKLLIEHALTHLNSNPNNRAKLVKSLEERVDDKKLLAEIFAVVKKAGLL
jgi:hypothetical protein